MNSNTLKSAAVVVASMTLAIPLLIGMVEITTTLGRNGLITVLLSFVVWAIAASYLVLHFLQERKNPVEE